MPAPNWVFNVIDASYLTKPGSSAAYSSTVVASAPLRYYHLDETAGTTATDAMGHANATYQNTPTLNQTGAVSGSKAVTFNGTTQYLLGDSGFSVGDNFSVECWVKTTSTAIQVIASRGVGACVVYLQSGVVRVDKSGNILIAKSNRTIHDGTFHHVVVTKAGGNTFIYVDGVDVTVNNASSICASGSGAWNYFRDQSGTFGFFAGTADELAIYNRALSQGEVVAHVGNVGVNPNRFSTLHRLKNATNRRLSRVFNRPGTFTFTFPLDSDDADAILTEQFMLEPYRIGIECIRNGLSIWSGYFQTFQIDYSAGTCSATVVGWQQKLSRRFAPSSQPYISWDAADLFANELARSNADTSDSGIRAKGVISNAYWLSPIDSDLTGGNDFNKILDFPKNALDDEFTFAVGASASDEEYGFAPAGQPGTAGVTGTYTINLRVKTGPVIGLTAPGYRGQLAVAVARVNATGTEQQRSSFTAAQDVDTSYTYYTFTVPNANLGVWGSGDRLKVIYKFTAVDSFVTNFTIQVGKASPNIASVFVPWAPKTNNTYSISNYSVQRFDNLGDLLQKLSDVENGFDFDLQITRNKTIASDAPVIQMVVWPSRGTDYSNRSNAPTFGINCGPDNAKELSLSIDGTTVVNRAIVKGRSNTPSVATASDNEQQRELFEEVLTLSDVGSTEVLNAFAASEVLIKRYARQIYSFAPEPYTGGKIVPQPMVDYDLGDTVRLLRRRRRSDGIVRANVRIFTMDISFDDNNTENVQLGTTPP